MKMAAAISAQERVMIISGKLHFKPLMDGLKN